MPRLVLCGSAIEYISRHITDAARALRTAVRVRELVMRSMEPTPVVDRKLTHTFHSLHTQLSLCS